MNSNQFIQNGVFVDYIVEFMPVQIHLIWIDQYDGASLSILKTLYLRKINIMESPKMGSKYPVAVDAIKDKKYAWCSCGLSTKQPFCNGAHRGYKFVPTIFTETEDKKIYLCNCKKTSNPPYCDGTHNKI